MPDGVVERASNVADIERVINNGCSERTLNVQTPNGYVTLNVLIDGTDGVTVYPKQGGYIRLTANAFLETCGELIAGEDPLLRLTLGGRKVMLDYR